MIDFIYRRIEEWIEGDTHSRRLLDEAPWNAEKLGKRVTKWVSFVAVSLLFAHAFIAYFVSWTGWAERYGNHFAQATPTLVALTVFSLIFLVAFGWFREQFCLVACPYGRWQTVWMDEQSMVVDYSARRGEPRRGAAQLGEKQGDCVNCYHCVQACPTGVDIRFGVQMECIACTACMDACDDVMTSLGKAPGLIRYTSFSQLRDPATREKPFRIIWRIRPLIYLGVLAVLGSALIIALQIRGPLWVYIKRPPGPLYLTSPAPGGAGGAVDIINTFNVSVRNQLRVAATLRLTAPPWAGFSITTANLDTPLAPGEQREFMLLAKFSRTSATSPRPPSSVPVRFEIVGGDGKERSEVEESVRFLGP